MANFLVASALLVIIALSMGFMLKMLLDTFGEPKSEKPRQRQDGGFAGYPGGDGSAGGDGGGCGGD